MLDAAELGRVLVHHEIPHHLFLWRLERTKRLHPTAPLALGDQEITIGPNLLGEYTALATWYAYSVDHFDGKAIGEVFQPEGSLDLTAVGYRVWKSREKILDGFTREVFPAISLCYHANTNHMILNSTEDSASAICYWQAFGAQDQGPFNHSAGTYEDELVRVGSEWLQSLAKPA